MDEIKLEHAAPRLRVFLERNQRQEEARALDAEQFLQRRRQRRGDDGQYDRGSMDRPTAQSATRPKGSKEGLDVAGREISITKRVASMGTIFRFNSTFALLPELTARRLHARALAIGRLAQGTKQWMGVDMYGEPLAPGQSAEGKLPDHGWWSQCSRAVHRLLTEPESSPWAYAVSVVIMTSIAVSTICFCLATVPVLEKSDHASHVFNLIEVICIQIFATDYVLRLLTAPDRKRFMLDPLSIIDLISFLPWYIMLAVHNGFQGTSVFRVLRLLRIFRVFKMGGHLRKVEVVVSTLAASVELVGLLLFFVALLLVFAATLMHLLERGEWHEEYSLYIRENEPLTVAWGNGSTRPIESPFSSIPKGWWWAIVTMMTVGYGDAVPLTWAGKIVTSFAMITGLLILALPISVLGTNFTTAWLEAKDSEKTQGGPPAPPQVQQLQTTLATHITNTEDLVKMFTTAEQGLDEVRNKLHDKIRSRKKDLEASLEATRHLQRNATAATFEGGAVAAAAAAAAAAVASTISGAAISADKAAKTVGMRSQPGSPKRSSERTVEMSRQFGSRAASAATVSAVAASLADGAESASSDGDGGGVDLLSTGGQERTTPPRRQASRRPPSRRATFNGGAPTHGANSLRPSWSGNAVGRGPMMSGSEVGSEALLTSWDRKQGALLRSSSSMRMPMRSFTGHYASAAPASAGVLPEQGPLWGSRRPSMQHDPTMGPILQRLSQASARFAQHTGPPSESVTSSASGLALGQSRTVSPPLSSLRPVPASAGNLQSNNDLYAGHAGVVTLGSPFRRPSDTSSAYSMPGGRAASAGQHPQVLWTQQRSPSGRGQALGEAVETTEGEEDFARASMQAGPGPEAAAVSAAEVQQPSSQPAGTAAGAHGQAQHAQHAQHAHGGPGHRARGDIDSAAGSGAWDRSLSGAEGGAAGSQPPGTDESLRPRPDQAQAPAEAQAHPGQAQPLQADLQQGHGQSQGQGGQQRSPGLQLAQHETSSLGQRMQAQAQQQQQGGRQPQAAAAVGAGAAAAGGTATVVVSSTNVLAAQFELPVSPGSSSAPVLESPAVGIALSSTATPEVATTANASPAAAASPGRPYMLGLTLGSPQSAPIPMHEAGGRAAPSSSSPAMSPTLADNSPSNHSRLHQNSRRRASGRSGGVLSSSPSNNYYQPSPSSAGRTGLTALTDLISPPSNPGRAEGSRHAAAAAAGGASPLGGRAEVGGAGPHMAGPDAYSGFAHGGIHPADDPLGGGSTHKLQAGDAGDHMAEANGLETDGFGYEEEDGGEGDLGGPAMQEFKNKLSELMGTQVFARYHKDLAEMAELEKTLLGHVSHLMDLMQVTGLLRGTSFPEDIREMRSTYRQIMALTQETTDTRTAMREMEEEVAEVAALVADLESRFGWEAPEPDTSEADAILDARAEELRSMAVGEPIDEESEGEYEDGDDGDEGAGAAGGQQASASADAQGRRRRSVRWLDAARASAGGGSSAGGGAAANGGGGGGGEAGAAAAEEERPSGGGRSSRPSMQLPFSWAGAYASIAGSISRRAGGGGGSAGGAGLLGKAGSARRPSWGGPGPAATGVGAGSGGGTGSGGGAAGERGSAGGMRGFLSMGRAGRQSFDRSSAPASLVPLSVLMKNAGLPSSPSTPGVRESDGGVEAGMVANPGWGMADGAMAHGAASAGGYGTTEGKGITGRLKGAAQVVVGMLRWQKAGGSTNYQPHESGGSGSQYTGRRVHPAASMSGAEMQGPVPPPGFSVHRGLPQRLSLAGLVPVNAGQTGPPQGKPPMRRNMSMGHPGHRPSGSGSGPLGLGGISGKKKGPNGASGQQSPMLGSPTIRNPAWEAAAAAAMAAAAEAQTTRRVLRHSETGGSHSTVGGSGRRAPSNLSSAQNPASISPSSSVPRSHHLAQTLQAAGLTQSPTPSSSTPTPLAMNLQQHQQQYGQAELAGAGPGLDAENSRSSPRSQPTSHSRSWNDAPSSGGGGVAAQAPLMVRQASSRGAGAYSGFEPLPPLPPSYDSMSEAMEGPDRSRTPAGLYQ